jgi:nucleoside-diphosphate kinase
MEKTVVILKHDAVARGLMGEIIHRFERAGLKLAAMKMVHATGEMGEKHYPSEETWFRRVGERSLKEYREKGVDPVKALGTADPVEIGKLVKKWNVDYLTEGPVLAMVFAGYDAIKMARKLVGATIPAQAAPGTIRGDYSVDSAELGNRRRRPARNLVHASGDEREAANELDLWFKPEEIFDYPRGDEEMMFR